MSSGGGDVVVGYRYYMDVLLTFCHGPVDEIAEIQGGERVAWSGLVTSNSTIQINKSELFGGESREGGWSGYVDIMLGGETQPVNTNLATSLVANEITTPSPAYRGVTSMFFRGATTEGFLWSAINPYFKAIKAKLRRYPTWYPAKARIGNDANPAHVIYECLTNRSWGLGFPVSDLDDTRFRAVADTLYTEGFGISLAWTQTSTIESFVGLILQHFNGVLNQDRTTGQLFLQLIRDDYDIENLLVLDPSNCTLENLARAGNGEVVNEITLKFTRAEDGEADSITIQDLASIQNQGRVIAQEVDLPGLRDPDLAARVAQRELQSRSRGLAKITLVATREVYSLYVGDVFKLDWPKMGISGLVCRVVSLDVGDLESATVRIEAVEDVFGLPSYSYVVSPPTGWVDISNTLVPVDAQRVIEAPYYVVVKRSTSGGRLDYPDDFGLGVLLAPAPVVSNPNFLMQWSPNNTTYYDLGNGYWSAYCVLAAPIDRDETSVVVSGQTGFSKVANGSLVFIGDEVMQVVSWSVNTITVIRGVLDSFPEEHDVGADLFILPDGLGGVDPAVRVAGETAWYKILPRSNQGTLASNLATGMSITFSGRFEKPYPPGNVKIGGEYFPSSLAAANNIAVTWAHRDRTAQTVLPLQTWKAGNVGPEVGVTYNVRVYNSLNQLVDSHGSLTGTSVTTLLGSDVRTGAHRFEVEAVRGGVVSRVFKHTVNLNQ